MLKIDFGSGYNPNKGYKLCDITYSPVLDYVYDQDNNVIIGAEENTVDEFYLRNVVHHLPDIAKTFTCLKKYLKVGGRIKIIDVRKEYFKQNLFLDRLWYRFVIPRPEVWYSTTYRDYFTILKELGFKLISYEYKEEKEMSEWEKN